MRVRSWQAYLFLLPSLLGLSAFCLLPFLFGLRFLVWSPGEGFLGTTALRSTLASGMFRLGLGNTALLCLLGVPLLLLLSLSLSFLLHEVGRASHWLRSLFFLPYVLPTVAVVFAFRWALDYRGPVGRLAAAFGLARPFLLSGPAALLSVLTVFLWKNAGFFVAFLTARLAGTPKEQLEEARLNGANWRGCVRFVYLPHLLPTLLFALVFAFVLAQDIFRETYLLAGNYPTPEIYTLQHFLYNRFHAGDYAGVVTAGYLPLLLLLLLLWLLFRGEKHV